MRTISSLVVAPAAAATSASSERLLTALRRPSRVDQRTVSQLEHVTIDLEGLESQVGPRTLLGPVVGHLNTLASLLQGTPKGALRRQLASIAGETAGLAGWLSWDLKDRRAAGAYFRAGIEAAQEAEDKALGAYLVGSSVVQRPTGNGQSPGCAGSKDARMALLAPTLTRRRGPGW